MKNLLHIGRVLLTPSCWIPALRYSKEWDKRLNWLMDYHGFACRGHDEGSGITVGRKEVTPERKAKGGRK